MRPTVLWQNSVGWITAVTNVRLVLTQALLVGGYKHFVKHEVEKVLISTHQLHQLLPFNFRKLVDFGGCTGLDDLEVAFEQPTVVIQLRWSLIAKVHLDKLLAKILSLSVNAVQKVVAEVVHLVHG